MRVPILQKFIPIYKSRGVIELIEARDRTMFVIDIPAGMYTDTNPFLLVSDGNEHLMSILQGLQDSGDFAETQVTTTERETQEEYQWSDMTDADVRGGNWLGEVADETARLALSPSDGDLCYQLDTNALWIYAGTSWGTVTSHYEEYFVNHLGSQDFHRWLGSRSIEELDTYFETNTFSTTVSTYVFREDINQLQRLTAIQTTNNLIYDFTWSDISSEDMQTGLTYEGEVADETARNALSPDDDDVVFQIDTRTFYHYTSSAWSEVSVSNLTTLFVDHIDMGSNEYTWADITDEDVNVGVGLWLGEVADETARLALSPTESDLCYQISTNSFWEYDEQLTSSWIEVSIEYVLRNHLDTDNYGSTYLGSFSIAELDTHFDTNTFDTTNSSSYVFREDIQQVQRLTSVTTTGLQSLLSFDSVEELDLHFDTNTLSDENSTYVYRPDVQEIQRLTAVQQKSEEVAGDNIDRWRDLPNDMTVAVGIEFNGTLTTEDVVNADFQNVGSTAPNWRGEVADRTTVDSPEDGDIVYQTDTGFFYTYNGTAWSEPVSVTDLFVADTRIDREWEIPTFAPGYRGYYPATISGSTYTVPDVSNPQAGDWVIPDGFADQTGVHALLTWNGTAWSPVVGGVENYITSYDTSLNHGFFDHDETLYTSPVIAADTQVYFYRGDIFPDRSDSNAIQELVSVREVSITPEWVGGNQTDAQIETYFEENPYDPDKVYYVHRNSGEVEKITQSPGWAIFNSGERGELARTELTLDDTQLQRNRNGTLGLTLANNAITTNIIGMFRAFAALTQGANTYTFRRILNLLTRYITLVAGAYDDNTPIHILNGAPPLPVNYLELLDALSDDDFPDLQRWDRLPTSTTFTVDGQGYADDAWADLDTLVSTDSTSTTLEFTWSDMSDADIRDGDRWRGEVADAAARQALTGLQGGDAVFQLDDGTLWEWNSFDNNWLDVTSKPGDTLTDYVGSIGDLNVVFLNQGYTDEELNTYFETNTFSTSHSTYVYRTGDVNQLQRLTAVTSVSTAPYDSVSGLSADELTITDRLATDAEIDIEIDDVIPVSGSSDSYTWADMTDSDVRGGSWLGEVADETARLALSASDGDLCYQLDTNALWIFNGTAWSNVTSHYEEYFVNHLGSQDFHRWLGSRSIEELNTYFETNTFSTTVSTYVFREDINQLQRLTAVTITQTLPEGANPRNPGETITSSITENLRIVTALSAGDTTYTYRKKLNVYLNWSDLIVGDTILGSIPIYEVYANHNISGNTELPTDLTDQQSYFAWNDSNGATAWFAWTNEQAEQQIIAWS